MTTEHLPARIAPDAIHEALLECRFDSAELPEAIIGKLLNVGRGSSFIRLPAAEIPLIIRDADPELRYQPIIEIKNPSATRVIKVGERVISIHALAPYPGWENFQTELATYIRHLYEKIDGVQCRRLGLRYINILKSVEHKVQGIENTNLNITKGNAPIHSPFALMYFNQHNFYTCVTRISTPETVQGLIPSNFSLLIDIDVHNEGMNQPSDAEGVLRWVEDAHKAEKREFFGLLSEEVVSRLEVSKQGDKDL